MTQKSSQVVLAIDLGTTSTKTLLVDRTGNVQGSHSVEYPLYTPSPERAEQDPEEIFQAVLTSVKALLTKHSKTSQDILCLSFSSAMHTLIAVDGENHPLTPSMTFADNRSSAYQKKVLEAHDGHEIYRRTGTPIHPMSPLLKLLWLRDNEPDIFRQAKRFVGIKEYVLAKWYDQYVIDYSLASATGMFNLEKLQWDEQALSLIGLSSDRLSEPVNTTHILTGMKSQFAESLGLSPETPCVVGASDGVLANLGIGAIEPGKAAVTIGTSGAVRGVVRKPVTDKQGRLFCYALHSDYWVIGGALNNGGIMFRWVRDELATLESYMARQNQQDPYTALTAIAETVPAGSEGLLFLPLLAGERAPYWNANARGVYFGLALHHEKKHMIRAVLEGVMYRIRSVGKALEEVGAPIEEIRASGGFARSMMWRQMMADVMNRSVVIPDSIESSGVGAAMLALFALGEVNNLDEINQWVSITNRHEPDHSVVGTYDRLYHLYEKVYDQLREPFDEISDIQRDFQKQEE